MQYKLCPQCNRPCTMDVTTCPQCGHAFRTVVPQPENRTVVVNASPQMKRCPACGNSLVASAQECPVCHFNYLSGQSGPIVQPGYRPCPNCQAMNPTNVRFCGHCGRDQFAPAWERTESAPSANAGLIGTMWTLTGIGILSTFAAPGPGFAVAFLLDIPAFIIAIVLVCSNGTDKANGWVKIGLEIVAFTIGFLNAAINRPHY